MMMLLLVLNFNCQKDDSTVLNEETSNEPQPILSRNVSFQELPNTAEIEKVLKNVKETLNSNGNDFQRSIEPDSVTILLDDVLYMTYAETHTYTFTIIRNNPEYYIENIVLHYNVENNSYDEYLVQYTMSGNDFIDVYNGLPLKENNTYVISKLDNGTFGGLVNRSGFCTQTCSTFYFNCTAGGNHSYGEACSGAPDQQPFFIEICGALTCYDTDPTQTSIDAGPSSGGGGTGNPGDSDIVFKPKPTEPCQYSSGGVGLTDSGGCVPVNETTQHQKNCDQLNILSSDPKIKQSFKDLQSKAEDAFITREFGYKFTVGADPELLELGNDLTQLRPQYGRQIYGMSHTHQDKLPGGDKVFPMFSVEDVFNLGMVAIRHSVHPKEFDLYVLTLTVKTDNGGTETFALKINNWLDFVSWINSYGTLSKQDRKRHEKNMRKKYEKTYNSGGGNIPLNYLNPFFKFLQDNNIEGVDMYQANDPSLNSWKRLELKNGSIIEENC